MKRFDDETYRIRALKNLVHMRSPMYGKIYADYIGTVVDEVWVMRDRVLVFPILSIKINNI